MKISIKKISSIIFVSIFISIIYNIIAPSGLNFLREETIVKNVKTIDYGITSDNSVVKELSGIEFETLAEIWYEKKAIIIDSRDQWEYSEGHIPGAINIPEFSFDPENKIVQELDRENVYIIYCEGDDCDVSKRLAKELLKLGFKKVYVYLGGFAEWVSKDMKVEVN